MTHNTESQAMTPDPQSVHAQTINILPPNEVLLSPAEVASLFRVDPKTVTRWAKLGKLSSIRTLGGHRRYRQSEVLGLLNQNSDQS